EGTRTHTSPHRTKGGADAQSRHRPPRERNNASVRVHTAQKGADAHGGSLAWSRVSARSDLRRVRNQLLAFLRSRDRGRTLPVRRRRGGDSGYAHRTGRPRLARLPADGGSRTVVRIPLPRTLRSGTWPPLQPQQAPRRPLR